MQMSSSLNSAHTILRNHCPTFSQEQNHFPEPRNMFPGDILALTEASESARTSAGVHLWAKGSIPAPYRKLSMGSTLV